MKKTNKGDISSILLAVFIVLGIQLILFAYSDNLFLSNPYNSFTRQALAWLDGSLHLPENIEWLELAVYEGNYYVSFPPFPSYILLPFAYFCGIETPDNLISLFVTIVGVIYACKIALHCSVPKSYAVFLPVLFYSASAVFQVTASSWLWFFAQNLSLTLTFMSVYYMLKNKKGKAMFFLCCAFGCRPLQILLLPFELYYLYCQSSSTKIKSKLYDLFLHKIWVYIPAAVLAISFMTLNYLRFGSVFEFGHNYLPEFTNSELGQFHISYIAQNISNLFELPSLSETFKLEIPKFNGMNIFICFPILIFYLYLLVKKIAETKKVDIQSCLIFLSVCAHILCLLAHKTMGGVHYGNRYIVDVLVLVFLSVCQMMQGKEEKQDFSKILLNILLIFGLVFNVLGFYSFYA